LSYRLDFTTAIHRRKKRIAFWSAAGVLCFILGGGAAGWKIYDIWTRPTLAQELVAYHDTVSRIEPVYRRWNELIEAYDAISPWYSLYWADSPTNVLAVLKRFAEHLPANLHPVRFSLRTGKACEMQFLLHLEDVDRIAQRDRAVRALESLFAPWNPTVTWREQYLGEIQSLPIGVSFDLRGAPFGHPPPPPDDLKQAMKRVETIRDEIRSLNIPKCHDRKSSQPLGSAVEGAWLRIAPDVRAGLLNGKDCWEQRKQHWLDPSRFLTETEDAVLRAGGGVPQELRQTRELWLAHANGRWPWEREKSFHAGRLAEEGRQLSRLVKSGLPPMALFNELHDKCASLVKALQRGWTEREVFHEGVAVRCLKELGGPNSAVNVSPEEMRDGLMCASWSLVLRPRESGENERVVSLTDFCEIIESLLSVNKGFLIEHIILDFENGSRIASRAQASGLLAVRIDSNAIESAERTDP
jgi:hypothetical protein